MVALLERAMGEGALGLSTGLIYPPCCYADTDELVALCTAVAQKNGVFVVHMRSESDHILAALDEMIEVGRRSPACTCTSRTSRSPGRDNWRHVEEMLAKVRAAQAAGVRITADQYPYVAGSTMFGAILPPWAHDGGSEETLERLASPDERARMRAAMEKPRPQRLGQLLAVDRAERHRHRRRAVGAAPRGDGQDGRRGGARRAGKEPLEFALRPAARRSAWACR